MCDVFCFSSIKKIAVQRARQHWREDGDGTTRRSKTSRVRVMPPLSIEKLSERRRCSLCNAIDSMIGGPADLRHSHK